jgi:hypothetical protein
MEHNELKPCPSCGGNKITMFRTVYPKRFKKWHLECDKCHYCGKRAVFAFTAKTAWNRRAENGKS